MNERQENLELPDEFVAPFDLLSIAAKSGRIAFAIGPKQENKNEEKESSACYYHRNFVANKNEAPPSTSNITTITIV